MARQLTAQGEEVQLVALFDTPAPLGKDEDFDLAAVIAGLGRERARQSQKDLTLTADDLRELPLDEQLARALDGMRRLGLVDTEVDVPLMRRFIDGYVVRRRAADGYQPGMYSGRVDLFRASKADAETLRHLPAARRRQREDPTLGWGSVAAGGVEIHPAPGFHDTMLLEPHVSAVAETLERCVLRAMR
jgi:thioesterase domain-containing protein